MINQLSFVFFVLWILPVSAQVSSFDPVMQHALGSHETTPCRAGVNVLYMVNSNAVTNSFIDKSFTAGFIDDTEKLRVENRLKDVNRMGYALDYGLYFRAPLSKHSYIIAGGSVIEHFNARFNSGLFNLVFNGNSRFAGQEVNLHPFRYLYYTYEKVFGGIEYYHSNEMAFSGSLSFIKGSRFQQMDFNRAVLYTSPLGDSVNLAADMSMDFAREGVKRMDAWFGFGTAINLSAIFYQRPAGIRWQVQLNDLGFIRWNSIDQYRKNGNTVFTGIRIDDFFATTDTIISSVGYDSIEDLIDMQHNNGKAMFFLPFTGEISTEKQFFEKVYIGCGLRFYAGPGALPLIFVNSTIHFPYRFYIRPVLAFGGYGAGDIGLGVYKHLGKNIFLGTETWFIEDFFAPRFTSGQGVSFTLSGLF